MMESRYSKLLGTAALLLAVVGVSALVARAGVREGELTAWVYLDPAAVRGGPIALGPAALADRRAYDIPIDETDRGIPERVLRQVRATGAEVRTASRWLRAVSVQATSSELDALEQLAFVTRIEPVRSAMGAPGPRRHTLAADVFAALEADSTLYGANWRAELMLGIPQAHDLGFTGTGVKIAILDTGFERMHDALFNRLIGAQRDFINGDTIVADEPGEAGNGLQETLGTWTWSLMAGLRQGLMIGPAYNATYYLAKVDKEPNDTQADEDRWVQAAEWADSLGVDIISSSLAYRYDFNDKPAYELPQLDGNTTPTSRAAAAAARKGILVVQSIGDALISKGSGSLAAPGDAEDIITVGAVDLDGQPLQLAGALTSAQGPNARGRTKPDLVAPAVNLVGAAAGPQEGTNSGLGGTTYAAPLIAGAAAQFMEAWPEYKRNPVEIRAALRLTGTNAMNPDNRVGWGIPNVAAAIMFPRGFEAHQLAQSDPAGVVSSIAPTFSWLPASTHPATTPIRFILQVARDTAFKQLLVTDTIENAFTHTLEQPLPAGTQFYWRVIAIGRAGITRRSTLGLNSTTREPFRIADWARLLNLAEPGASTDSTRPTFRWNAIDAPAPAGPLRFDVEVFAADGVTIVQRVRDLPSSTRTHRFTQDLVPNFSYRWRVIAHSATGLADTIPLSATFIVNAAEQPAATLLYQNFPNPFPRTDLGTFGTRVWFDLAEPAAVQLTVHDTRGRLVRSLVPGRGCTASVLPAGQYGRQGAEGITCGTTLWDATDDNGEKVQRGVYVLRLVAGGKTEYRRMLYNPN